MYNQFKEVFSKEYFNLEQINVIARSNFRVAKTRIIWNHLVTNT